MNTIYNYIVNYTQNNKIASTITKKKKISIVRITPSLPTSKHQPKFTINNRNYN